jgi:hypothetical protein
LQGALRATGPERAAPAGVRPLLLVDIDGVLSLFGFPPGSGPVSGLSTGQQGGAAAPTAPSARTPEGPPEGRFHSIDGIPHFLSTTAAQHLLELVSVFDLVWASGWEEKADEYLPHLLGLPRGLPFLSFRRAMGGMGGIGAAGAQAAGPGTDESPPGSTQTPAHWKLEAIDAYAGPDRALAWIDDAFNEACFEWAKARPGATLLVPTLPHAGLEERDATRLKAWAVRPPRREAFEPSP